MTSEMLDNFISEYIAPTLKGFGFSRSGRTFYLLSSGNFRIIHFQKSKDSDDDVMNFTVNIGAYSAIVGRKLRTLSSRKKPQVWDCHWRERLGKLLGEDNKWWAINSSTDIKTLGFELQEDLSNLAVPEIKKYMDEESLRNLWLSGRSPGLTNLERLRCLWIVLEEIGPEELIAPVSAELERKQRHVVGDEIAVALRRLGWTYDPQAGMWSFPEETT